MPLCIDKLLKRLSLEIITRDTCVAFCNSSSRNFRWGKNSFIAQFASMIVKID
jgi:hypothetical protein